MGLYASFVEPFRLTVTRWDVVTEKWGAQPEIKIALIADVHAIWPWMSARHIQDIVEATNALEPDLVLCCSF